MSTQVDFSVLQPCIGLCLAIPVMVTALLLSNVSDQKSHPNLHKAVMVVKYHPPLCPLLISCVYFRLHSAEEQLLAFDLKKKGSIYGSYMSTLLYFRQHFKTLLGV